MEKFNGKPMSYWRREADKLVMDTLVRAITSFGCDNSSIIHKLARKRLEQLAQTENAELYSEVLEERDRCLGNFNTLMNDMIGTR
jgi:hypothetical protein